MDAIFIFVAGAALSALAAVFAWILFGASRGAVRRVGRVRSFRRRRGASPRQERASAGVEPRSAMDERSAMSTAFASPGPVSDEPASHEPVSPEPLPDVQASDEHAHRAAPTRERRPFAWFVRCANCNRSRLAREVGVIRAWARGTKHTMGFCRGCRRVRHIIIERRPADVAQRQDVA